jgi:hypothetical protein
MARIVTEATSLTRKRDGLHRETAGLNLLQRIEIALAGALLVPGVILFAARGKTALLWTSLILGVAAAAHRLRIRENRSEERAVQAGLRGEADVARTLSEALDQTHYLFNDLLIRDGRATAQIDHLVVSPKGLFVIETKNWRGHIEGHAQEERWAQTREPGQAPVPVFSPILQAKRQAEFLREYLARTGITVPDIHPLVVFRSPRTTFSVHGADLPVLRPAEAARHIAGFAAPRLYTEAELDALLRHLAGAA